MRAFMVLYCERWASSTSRKMWAKITNLRLLSALSNLWTKVVTRLAFSSLIRSNRFLPEVAQ